MSMTIPPIIERLSLTELKEFLVSQDLSNKYTTEDDSIFKRFTTPEGMDLQSSYADMSVEAKMWIQYFPKANQFAFNINFFATIDGAPLNSEDFLRYVPDATKLVNYVNGLKIQWIMNDNGVYVKHMPEVVTINVPSKIDNIYTKTQI